MKFLDTFSPINITLELDKKSYPILSFGDFLLLENYKLKLKKTIDLEEIKKILLDIIKLQTKKEFIDYKPIDVLRSVFQILNENRLRSEAVFLSPPPTDPNEENVKPKKKRYDYDGRFFAQWIDILASAYSWSEQEILNMNIDRITYYIQEIMVNKFHEKEWNYRLTELAYHYDATNKKSTYKPLTPPYWMNDKIDGKIHKTKIPINLLPYGVQNISGYEKLSRDVEEPKNEKTE